MAIQGTVVFCILGFIYQPQRLPLWQDSSLFIDWSAAPQQSAQVIKTVKSFIHLQVTSRSTEGGSFNFT